MFAAKRVAFTVTDVNGLKQAEKNSFWFFTFFHLNYMGNTAKRQQFELAYMLDGKGLSDTGRNILATLDIGVGKGTFDDYKTAYLNQAEADTRSLMTFFKLYSDVLLLHVCFLLIACSH
jgi:hypothetical protein